MPIVKSTDAFVSTERLLFCNGLVELIELGKFNLNQSSKA